MKTTACVPRLGAGALALTLTGGLLSAAVIAPSAVAESESAGAAAAPASSPQHRPHPVHPEHPGKGPKNPHPVHPEHPGKGPKHPHHPGTPEEFDWDRDAYRGQVDVRRTPHDSRPKDPNVLTGRVFVDADRDSRRHPSEKGLAGVRVSNGEDVVLTDKHGRYELPVRDNMTVFVTQPTGYRVPVDADNVPQFHYHHLPDGSPELEHGGIAPTGELPAAVNFPVVADERMAEEDQRCLIGGDVQTYTEQEVEYARSGAFADLAERTDYTDCGILFIGDIVGDRPDLYPQSRELSSMLNGPAWFLPGNHDLDFDTPDSEHAFDSFRAALGPEYYSYDVGDAHVIALSSVEYPLADSSGYNGSIDERQMEWLRQDIAATPKDKKIVLGTHVPLMSFADSTSATHSIDQVPEIYELLEGREVITVGGHTHSTENLRAGDLVAGWKDLFGIDGLPFDHLVAGAISGDWYSGRLVDGDRYPLAAQRDGALPGVVTLDLTAEGIASRFTVRGDDGSDQMSLGLNTPAYREWFEANQDHAKKGGAKPLADPHTVAAEDLAGTWLTANVFMGATGTRVEVSVDGAEPVPATRTQEMDGEEVRVGAEYSDPAAAQEQLVHGGSLADRTMHLWRLPLPSDLAAGEHTAEVTVTDLNGERHTESIDFTVR